MISKPVALGLVAAACVTAAAGGAYVAVRQNQSGERVRVEATPVPDKAQQAVAETEAVVPPPEVEATTPARNLSRPFAPKPERPAPVATKHVREEHVAASACTRRSPSRTVAPGADIARAAARDRASVANARGCASSCFNSANDCDCRRTCCE